MNEPTVEFRDNPAQSRYEAPFRDGSIAYKPYRLAKGKIALRQTVVPGSHGGRGVGPRLDAFAESDARKRNLTIIPGCPFVEE
ncbi:MAG: GNAT family N-acetyltransferase [Gemmatimonadota bacterium]|jgi:hypothetical protein